MLLALTLNSHSRAQVGLELFDSLALGSSAGGMTRYTRAWLKVLLVEPIIAGSQSPHFCCDWAEDTRIGTRSCCRFQYCLENFVFGQQYYLETCHRLPPSGLLKNCLPGSK